MRISAEDDRFIYFIFYPDQTVEHTGSTECEGLENPLTGILIYDLRGIIGLFVRDG